MGLTVSRLEPYTTNNVIWFCDDDVRRHTPPKTAGGEPRMTQKQGG